MGVDVALEERPVRPALFAGGPSDFTGEHTVRMLCRQERLPELRPGFRADPVWSPPRPDLITPVGRSAVAVDQPQRASTVAVVYGQAGEAFPKLSLIWAPSVVSIDPSQL